MSITNDDYLWPRQKCAGIIEGWIVQVPGLGRVRRLALLGTQSRLVFFVLPVRSSEASVGSLVS